MNQDLILELDLQLDSFFLGINRDCASNNNEKDLAAYIGLDFTALQTPYVDYYQILSDIPANEVLYDLGAGYSRGSFVANALNLPRCIGLEYVPERVEHTKKRLALFNYSNNIRLFNLVEEKLPAGRHFYLYFPKGKAFNHIISQLLDMARQDKIYLYVAESHGDVIEYLDSFPGYFQVINQFPCSIKRHYPYINKYLIKPPTPVDWEICFESWYLMNHDQKMVAKFEYFDHQTHSTVNWYIGLGHLELIHYAGDFALQVYLKNRIIEYRRDEKLIEVLELAQFTPEEQDLLLSTPLGFKSND